MIRFTSGTLFKVISLCKSGRRYSDDTIASMLFPNVKYTTNYIGHVKNCTKNATTVNPIEFIANALFCVCNQQNNTDGKADIKIINDDFIKNLQSKAASITLQTIISTQEEAMSSVMPAVIGDDYSILYEEPKQNS